jgi:hypothetical protein
MERFGVDPQPVAVPHACGDRACHCCLPDSSGADQCAASGHAQEVADLLNQLLASNWGLGVH